MWLALRTPGQKIQAMKEEVASQLTRPIPTQILRRPCPEKDLKHQKDCDRRDRKFEESILLIASEPLSKKRIPRSYNQSYYEDTLKKIDRAL
jgi:hypothetical protein